MTVTEQLKHELDALPPEVREAVAEKSVTFDDIKHLLGKGRGPSDLSTNPKYMDDFGESSMR